MREKGSSFNGGFAPFGKTVMMGICGETAAITSQNDPRSCAHSRRPVKTRLCRANVCDAFSRRCLSRLVMIAEEMRAREFLRLTASVLLVSISLRPRRRHISGGGCHSLCFQAARSKCITGLSPVGLSLHVIGFASAVCLAGSSKLPSPRRSQCPAHLMRPIIGAFARLRVPLGSCFYTLF